MMKTEIVSIPQHFKFNNAQVAVNDLCFNTSITTINPFDLKT